VNVLGAFQILYSGGILMLQFVTSHLESTIVFGVLLELLDQATLRLDTIRWTIPRSSVQLLDLNSLQANLFVERPDICSFLLLLLKQ
jgi:hypothetical protein